MLTFAFFVVDSHKDSNFSCRIFWTPRYELDDVTGASSKQYRIQSDIRERITGIVNGLEAGVWGTIGELRGEAIEISVNPVINVFWDFPWGASLRGV